MNWYECPDCLAKWWAGSDRKLVCRCGCDARKINQPSELAPGQRNVAAMVGELFEGDEPHVRELSGGFATVVAGPWQYPDSPNKFRQYTWDMDQGWVSTADHGPHGRCLGDVAWAQDQLPRAKAAWVILHEKLAGKRAKVHELSQVPTELHETMDDASPEAQAVRRAATELTKRITDFEQRLMATPGRCRTRVKCDDQAFPFVLEFGKHNSGRWAIWVSLDELTGARLTRERDRTWALLRDADLETKALVAHKVPELLTRMVESQRSFTRLLATATQQFDAALEVAAARKLDVRG